MLYIHFSESLPADVEEEARDEFFCRKCDKVFTQLSEYLEHKIKDENFRITQTRSKSDKRFSLPNLVQKRKRKVIKRKQKTSEDNQSAKKKDETGAAAVNQAKGLCF